tara:strand:+ start:242 stop:475 length:234 start_codon:yes stop_codon:yes gene_type:complete
MSKVDLNQILRIISETIQEPASKININSKACDFAKWDSLSQVTMMIKIEKTVKKKINTSKISELNSVKKIVEYLETK